MSTQQVIITSLSKNYLKMFSIWKHFFDQLDLGIRLRVIVFDDESEQYARENNLYFHRLNEDNVSPRKIFARRIEIFKIYLREGVDVVHTDADAYWLDGKIVAFLNQRSEDIVISKGHGIPEEAVEKWKFSLCCGFFYLRANKKVLKFVEDWHARTIEIEKNDQIAMNRILLLNNVQWEKPHKYEASKGYCEYYDLHMHAIDYVKIPRDPDSISNNTFVFHPYLPSRLEAEKVTSVLKILTDKNLLTPTEVRKIKKSIHYELFTIKSSLVKALGYG